MTQSWTIHMGDYPVDIETARVLAARFEGLSMVGASDGYADTYTVMVAAEGGTCPVEVNPWAFAAIAGHVAANADRKPMVVLSRTNPEHSFGFAGFCAHDEAGLLASRLRSG